MGIITLLITISVTIAILFLGVFYWNMKSGQYDDTYTPSVRMLFDDKPGSAETKKSESKKSDKNQVSV
ncbi:cbb3-type cytochrome oxidase assembly protein CcoS [Ohtaekwangia koreensis]|jgi:cbb3-type cytochrome oxidase maturation protein|uniref:Cytochrome oxidase maturation protein, cbb3-type n=1 Tax=Ohtaekwangia koreensis TaxID=688867 RepID=A0A1T5IXT5_9BACT|nr:cbb3-type cytochrome oxidase assembly protein CcoS [Ohtaekwangia koreensis]SKC43748.1 cytochrome oxidase maturation protein, cbb3-type [Ohtaekwangia koreensis]